MSEINHSHSPFQISKYSCGGNDFLIMDCRATSVPDKSAHLAKQICDRREGIGADGLIFLLSDPALPFRMKLINADGSPAEVSYNGSRCVGKYALDHKIASAPFTFASDAGNIAIDMVEKEISLHIPTPTDVRLGFDLELHGEKIRANFIRSGVPWLVLYHDDLTAEWVEKTAPLLKTHSEFPAGTNVAVGHKVNDGSIEARFFERGVDDETPSSGSGCVSVALVSSLVYDLDSPVPVKTKGGDFKIFFRKKGSEISDVVTAAKVVCAFSGDIILPK